MRCGSDRRPVGVPALTQPDPQEIQHILSDVLAHFPCCEFQMRMLRTVFIILRSVALSRAEIFGFDRSLLDAIRISA